MASPLAPLTALPQHFKETHHMLNFLVPESELDGAASNVTSDSCAMHLSCQRSFTSDPMIPEPFVARPSREDEAFTALQNVQSSCEAYVPKSAVWDSVLFLHDEASPATNSAWSASHNHHRSFLLTATIEPLKTSRKCNVNQAFPFVPIVARVQPCLYKNPHQLNEPNSSMPEYLCSGEVSCAGCATYKDQSNISPKLVTMDPHYVSVPCPENSIFGMYRYRQSSVIVPHINVVAEVGNEAVPFVYTTLVPPPQLDGVCFPCFEPAACNLGWSRSHTILMTERCKLIKQQPGGHCRSFKASLVDHGGLRSGSSKGFSERFLLCAKADYYRWLGPDLRMTSPMLCSYPSIISIPKCISIRADSHFHKLHIPNTQKTSAATGLSPTDYNKPYRHRHHGTPTTAEVLEQTKVVALAENSTCLAFLQGMYKTEMCNNWVRSLGQYCPYGNKCRFAHGPHELRPVLRNHRYKTILCRMVAAGKPCPYEHRCHFRHVVLTPFTN